MLQGEWLTRGYADHPFHQVQTGDAFGHWVFHLQTGVHLEEIKALVFTDHKLDRASALVFHRFGQSHRLFAHGFTGGVADERRRRLFNHLLMTALYRALALVQIQNMALGVTNQLDFDMAGFFDELFNKDTVVAEAIACFVTATGETFQRLFVVVGHAQTFTATTCTSFDHHGVANAFGNLDGFLRCFDGIVHTRNAIHACFCSELFGSDFVAHRCDGMVFRSYENNARFFTALRELSVLTQKTIPRVDRFGTRFLGSSDDFVGYQIGLTRR